MQAGDRVYDRVFGELGTVEKVRTDDAGGALIDVRLDSTPDAVMVERPHEVLLVPALPLSVQYYQPGNCDWHEKSCPRLVGADGSVVFEMPQFVGHPGEYDERADNIAHLVALAINSFTKSESH